jgi:hypothetical protein
MKIINPLYDKAFKYLMENNKFAKKVLSVILDVDIEEVTLENQETFVPYSFATQKLTLFRLDFKAIIKEADGTRKTVLIELQKSKFSTDIQRFRNYLGANYMARPKEKSLVEEPFVEYQTPFPIITIYILGYNLDDLPYMAVNVNRDIINAVNKEKISVKSFFIEHLTHQSHIIQIRRLPEKRQTRLEKFLMLFNQAWCTEEGYIIDLQEVPKGFLDMANYLQSPLMDDNFRRNLEAEEQLDYIFGQQEVKYLKQIADAEKAKQEAEKRELLERTHKEEERKQKEEERTQKLILAKELAILLKQMGMTADMIAEKTGLSESEIVML